MVDLSHYKGDSNFNIFRNLKVLNLALRPLPWTINKPFSRFMVQNLSKFTSIDSLNVSVDLLAKMAVNAPNCRHLRLYDWKDFTSNSATLSLCENLRNANIRDSVISLVLGNTLYEERIPLLDSTFPNLGKLVVERDRNTTSAGLQCVFPISLEELEISISYVEHLSALKSLPALKKLVVRFIERYTPHPLNLPRIPKLGSHLADLDSLVSHLHKYLPTSLPLHNFFAFHSSCEENLMIRAAKYGNLGTIEAIVQRFPDWDINATSKENVTAINVAAAQHKLGETVLLLLQLGANPLIANKTTGLSALTSAIARHDVPLAKTIVEFCARHDLDWQDHLFRAPPFGISAIHAAYLDRRLGQTSDMHSWLFSLGLSPKQLGFYDLSSRRSASTPLVHFLWKVDPDIVFEFQSQFNLDLSTRDLRGRSLIHMNFGDRKHLSKLFSQAGLKPYDTDFSGCTVAHMAAEQRDAATLCQLVQDGLSLVGIIKHFVEHRKGDMYARTTR
jgi:hypothetical protein